MVKSYTKKESYHFIKYFISKKRNLVMNWFGYLKIQKNNFIWNFRKE